MSAFIVAKSKSSLCGFGKLSLFDLCNADIAKLLWAIEGGLKDESSMNNVLGDSLSNSVGTSSVGSGVCTVFSTLNLESDSWKVFNAEPIVLTKDLRAAVRDAISSVML